MAMPALDSLWRTQGAPICGSAPIAARIERGRLKKDVDLQVRHMCTVRKSVSRRSEISSYSQTCSSCPPHVTLKGPACLAPQRVFEKTFFKKAFELVEGAASGLCFAPTSDLEEERPIKSSVKKTEGQRSIRSLQVAIHHCSACCTAQSLRPSCWQSAGACVRQYDRRRRS